MSPGFGSTKQDKSPKKGGVAVQDVVKMATPQVTISLTKNGGFIVNVISSKVNDLYMASQLQEALDIVDYHMKEIITGRE